MHHAGAIGGRIMEVSGCSFSRLRAFRSEDGEVQVLRQMFRLSLCCREPAGLARALREVRKAALAGGGGYDPVRHAALLRMSRLKRRDGTAGGPS